jgi:hypothetical protein
MSSMSSDRVDALSRMKSLIEYHKQITRLKVTSETTRAAQDWLDEAVRLRTEFPKWASRIAALELKMLDAYPNL